MCRRDGLGARMPSLALLAVTSALCWRHGVVGIIFVAV